MTGLCGVKFLSFVIFFNGFCWGLRVFVSNFALLFATGRAGCLCCAKTELKTAIWAGFGWFAGLGRCGLMIGRFGDRTGLSKCRSLLILFLVALQAV